MGETNERCHTPNQWAPDEECFESNWSTLHNQGDATFQADTINMVLKTRVYFASVVTFGTTQIDDQGIEVPYGNQGSGRCIFDMYQVITPDLLRPTPHMSTILLIMSELEMYSKSFWLIILIQTGTMY